MPVSRIQRLAVWLLATVIVLAVVVAGGLFAATRALKSQIESALGPHGEIGEIRVGFSAIEVLDLRIKAAKGWPSEDELRAKRVTVTPDLAALLSRSFRVSSIEIEDAYLSMLRRKDGKVLVLPSLLDAAASPQGAQKPGESLPEIILGSVVLQNSAIEFFDATVRQPAHKMRLEQVKAKLGPLLLPKMNGRTAIELAGVVKGVQRDGQLLIRGSAELATRNSEVKTQLRGMDLVAFQPYLIKAADTGVKRGTLDLDLDSTVRDNRLHAPGTVTLSGLELSGSGGFLGMSQNSLVSALKDKQGRITAKFVLEGNLADPKFSLNESFSGQIGLAVGKTLGLSLEGLAKGVGTAGGGAARSLGDTLGKLFSK